MASTIQSMCTPLLARFRVAFVDHPESIGESYVQHFCVAMGFAGSLLIIAGAAIVHALVPCLCETTARTKIAALNERLQGRAHQSSTDVCSAEEH